MVEAKRSCGRRLEDVRSFIGGLYGPDLHAKRVDALAGATLGVMTGASLAVAAIGQALAQARGLVTKHAVKQVDRLMGNQGIDASLKPVQEKLKDLTRLATADQHHAPDQTFTVVSWEFQAVVGERARARAVTDVRQAIELLNAAKADLAYEVVTVPLGKLDNYLTPEQAAEVLEVSWGDRSVRVMKKVALQLDASINLAFGAGF